ncbi:hypothetical protein NQ317_005915 [Molorchus minor]|uniref:Uncharacterized protein n=1 Tax=Molorchus minor TaxID=1323400 RepID=A0ABQ9JES3_9CUCU|nr:hypothetical protein NQ317_005915 [Molorchus minor]
MIERCNTDANSETRIIFSGEETFTFTLKGTVTGEKYISGIAQRPCTMNNCESEEIVEAANIAISNLLPTKLRSLYDIAYNWFKNWCAEKKCSNIQRECFVGILQ